MNSKSFLIAGTLLALLPLTACKPPEAAPPEQKAPDAAAAPAAATTPATAAAPAAPAQPTFALGAFPAQAIGQLKLTYWEQQTTVKAASRTTFKVGIVNDSDYYLSAGTKESPQIKATWYDPASFAEIQSTLFPLTVPLRTKDRGGEALDLATPAKPGSYLLKVVLVDANGQSLEAAGVGPLHYSVAAE